MQTKVVIGLGYGDEGKGITVARECGKFCKAGKSPAVVRFSGGPQNAHNVCWHDLAGVERHFTFSQLGASTRPSPVFTSWHVPVNPVSFYAEAGAYARVSEDAGVAVTEESLLSRHHFCEDSPLILPAMVEAARARETAVRHGSQGQGIYEVRKFNEVYPDKAFTLKLLKQTDAVDAVAERVRLLGEWVNAGMPKEDDTLTFTPTQDILDVDDAVNQWRKHAHDLSAFAERVYSRICWLNRLSAVETAVFEGGQGVLLDKDCGEFPHVTYGNTTTRNAFEVLGALVARTPIREEDIEHEFIGVIRCYATRHGAGNLANEYEQASRPHRLYASAETHNVANIAGHMRFAPFSAAKFLYACSHAFGRIDRLVLTHADVMPEFEFIGRDESSLFLKSPDMLAAYLRDSMSPYSNGLPMVELYGSPFVEAEPWPPLK